MEVALSKILSLADITVKSAIKKIDDNSKKIIFIVNEQNQLLGTVTDGDIRRWILANEDLEQPVSKVMNPNPVYIAKKNESDAYTIMKEKNIDALPLVDEKGTVSHVFFWSDFFVDDFNKHGKVHVPVVIMAGGKGSRLYPYTKILPKPLIPIGDTPIVERIMDKFHSYGCDEFYMTVNYKKNMIRSYFMEAMPPYSIDFVEEETPLGTGGSLSLLKEKIKGTFFLSNCDILIDADYSSIYKYHQEMGNQITMVTSLKNYVIPYGVVNIDQESKVKSILEKPENHYLVNTGMYVLEENLLDKIPEKTFYHITELIEACIREGIKVGTYPISEGSWLDMGQFKEMDVMLDKLGIKS